MASRAMPTHNGPPAKSSEAPNKTLYITNLPDKIRKPDLRMALYMLFATYGPVLDVVAMKTAKTRGQAHIVFKTNETSAIAMRALQGFEFFGKELKIQYARGTSNVFKRLEGAYKAPTTGANVPAEGQSSIFTAPLPSSTGNVPPPNALKAPDAVPADARAESEGPQGVKRRREEESEGDEDSDVSMEASSDEEE